MGFLKDSIDASFRTAKDGTKLYFPWGPWGSGYIIPSDNEYKKLHKVTTVMMKVGLPFLIVTAPWVNIYANRLTGSHGMAVIMVAVYVLVVYVPCILWSRVQCRRMKRTDENF